MAIMIPDPWTSRSTVGKKRTYGLLRDLLPDSFTVWYEPLIQGRYPDFTLLAGSFGLLILETMGWSPKLLVEVTVREVALLRSVAQPEHLGSHRIPIRQVREYLLGMMDEPGRPGLAITSTGSRQGQVLLALVSRLSPNIRHAPHREVGPPGKDTPGRG